MEEDSKRAEELNLFLRTTQIKEQATQKIWRWHDIGSDCKVVGGESEEIVCKNGMPFLKDKL